MYFFLNNYFVVIVSITITLINIHTKNIILKRGVLDLEVKQQKDLNSQNGVNLKIQMILIKKMKQKV